MKPPMAQHPSKKLLIVESPGKLKTLRKILGPGWILEASVGHTTELAHDGPKRLGFEFEGERVRTRYVPRGERGKGVLSKLRKAAREAEMVYLATDPDREGEAIAWHLVEQLGLKRFVRVAYTQITDSAVKRAIASPLKLDVSLVESQRARQCLDKLVGFEVSPLLWGSTGGKSAGRVQSATLHLICSRERERLDFKPESYWTLRSLYHEGFEARFERLSTDPAPPPASARAEVAAPGEAPEASRVKSEEEARLIAEVARSSPHLVQSRDEKEESRNPPPPLITSSLQQMAGARHRYSPKQTMQIAQELYEGVGGKGLITYMRTDAVALSPEFVSEARAWIQANAPEALPAQAPFYRVKGEAQGAHEAIRPTSAELTPEEARRKHGLSIEQFNVYRLVWERAIASQCKPARLSKARIQISCAETLWVARGMTILEQGYLRFWKNLEEEKELPRVAAGQRLRFKDVEIEARTTQPPSRYSEPKLVQLMEKKGIGRPSTYASTVATLKDRDYVVLDKGLLAPTPLGMATDEALTKALPDLVDAAFTAKMEDSLDRIAEGKLQWERYLVGWNREYLAPALERAREVLKGVGPAQASEPSARRFASRAEAPSQARPAARKPRRGRFSSGRKRAGGNDSPSAQAARKKPGKRRVSASSAPLAGSEAHERLKSALEQARSEGVLPRCASGHGDLEPRVSQKGALYWKCPKEGCDQFAWHQEFSDQACPGCGARMEKVPSAKVTGGYFLKCGRKERHGDGEGDVVLFRSRLTQEWERPGPRRT